MSDHKKESPHERQAFWTVVIVLVVGVLLVLAIINFKIVPSYVSSANSCINNLRQINAAVQQFALEHELTNGSPINFPDDLTPYIAPEFLTNVVHCPRGGTYHISKVGETPTCSLGTNVVPAHVLH